MEPGDSDASAAVAVEVRQPPTARPFAAGIAIGLAIAAIGAHVYFVRVVAAMRSFYREMNPEIVPPVTWIVTSPVWSISVPIITGAALAVLLWRRPRALWPYLALAGTLLLTFGFTWYFFDAPMRMVAGNIK